MFIHFRLANDGLKLTLSRERAREAQRSGVFCGAYSLVPNPAVTATSPTLEAIDQKL